MTDTQTDRVLRAMTDDGAFRVMTLRATDMVRGVMAAQSAVGDAAVQFGELLCGAVLMRETMAPDHRLQMLIVHPEHGQLVADAWAEGRTRGLVQLADARRPIALGDGTHLQVVRVVHGGRQHQGVVETAAEGGLSDALMRYFQQSEQIVTMTQVACVMADEQVRVAGGFVIQLLPELTEPPLATMTERLRNFGALGPRLLAVDGDPQALRDALLEDLPFTHLAADPVSFACPCNESRAVAAIATLGRDDVRDLLERDAEMPVDCDYCGERYVMRSEHFRRVLEVMDDTGEGG